MTNSYKISPRLQNCYCINYTHSVGIESSINSVSSSEQVEQVSIATSSSVIVSPNVRLVYVISDPCKLPIGNSLHVTQSKITIF